MGLLAGTRAVRFLPLFALAAYAALAGFTILRHEPWPDEAQSWLLARDATLRQLWTNLLHYEGSPGLWQTLLHLLQRAGLPYAGINVVSGLLGLTAAALAVLYAPFPAALRLALPFTYYLFYQYAVVARGYSLLPPLLFGCAILFANLRRNLAALTLLLCLMAAVSVHGLVLSASILLAAHLALFQAGEFRRPRAILLYTAVYAVTAALMVYAAWPAPDVTFVRRLNFSVPHFFETARGTFAEAFTGEWRSSLAAAALSLPFLWRNGAFAVFLLSALSLCLVNAVVYSQVWHRGLLFLAWVFAMWLAARSTRLTWPAAAALLAVVSLQIYWSAAAATYDAKHPYSGAKEAAQHLPQGDIYCIGYACVAVQPYFPRNIFANLNHAAYWDWSARNQSLANLPQLSALHPPYVLVGYTGPEEDILWNSAVRHSGYRLIRHFEGNIFWRTAILEPDSFNLYERIP